MQLVRNGISKITERSDVTSHPVNHILVNEETKIKSQIEISDRYKASLLGPYPCDTARKFVLMDRKRSIILSNVVSSLSSIVSTLILSDVVGSLSSIVSILATTSSTNISGGEI